MEPLAEKIKEELDRILLTEKTNGWNLFETTSKCPYDDKLSEGSYKLTFTGWMDSHAYKEQTIASFELRPMINCCGICVSTRALVDEAFRHKGLGRLLNQLRMDIARRLGYSLLLCTDIEQNVAQRTILRQNGWKDIYSFLNQRTRNKVFISVIGL